MLEMEPPDHSSQAPQTSHYLRLNVWAEQMFWMGLSIVSLWGFVNTPIHLLEDLFRMGILMALW
jgi:hypothetical protein